MIKSAFNGLTKTTRTKVLNLSTMFVLALSGFGAALPVLLPQTANAAAGPSGPSSTVIVSGNTSAGENLPGWLFNRDVSTSTPYEFNYDQASLGNGSLYVKPIGANPSDKFIGEDFIHTALSDVNFISYDFRIGDSRTDADTPQFYMSVYANFGSTNSANPNNFYDCRYNVIASVGSNGAFSNSSFDPNHAYSVTTRGTSPHTCPPIPSQMDTIDAGSAVRAFALNVGDTSASDIGVEGYLDNVVVDTVASKTTYDFEPQSIPCSTDETTFDPFNIGSVNGQGGWSSTGPYDQEIVDNTYGYTTFGCKSLRMSNGFASNSFGDQTFSYSTANEAGEADSTDGGQSGGTRQSHYEAQFDIASTQASVQPGMVTSVSPDRGDGSRMSYLRFEDGVSGIDVYFDDVQGTTNPANFVETSLGTISRTAPHTIKFVIDYVDGPSNDVVKVYIDGVLVHTGTTWENYYRYDSESSSEQTPRTTDSLLFREGGSSVPSNSGNGFLFDNVGITTSTPDTTAPTTPVASPPAGTYTGTQSVSLTSSDSDSGLANIYYTTDGSTPTNASAVYTSPISVSSSQTIKAIAYDNAGNASPVLTAAYTINASGGGSSGGGSGGSGGSSSPASTGGTNTVTGGGRGAGFFANFGVDAGQVLGVTNDNNSDKDNKNGKVKSVSVTKVSKTTDSDNAFLGLGWWWLLILAALAALAYYLYRRFRPSVEV